MIFIKKLTKSDLTIIYENVELNRKQMAIVLFRDFMRSMNYDHDDCEQGFGLALEMTFYGPDGGAALYYPDAEISRHSKDWRIQQCVIKDTDYQAGRFDGLIPDSYFVFSLDLETEPATGLGVFLIHASESDAPYIALLRGKEGTLSSTEFSELLATIDNDVRHPLRELGGADSLDADQLALEDIAQGGEHALRGQGGCTAEELEQRLLEAKRIGDSGEALFDQWLESKPIFDEANVVGHEWTAAQNAIAPYDFKIFLDDDSELLVEVKTTTGVFDRPFYISNGELCNMANTDVPEVALARIFQVDTQPRMRVSIRNCDQARDLLQAMELGDQVEVVTLALKPDLFDFDENEIDL